MAKEAEAKGSLDDGHVDPLGPTWVKRHAPAGTGLGSRADPAVPGTVLQHYEVIRPLGAGGMGAVYLSRDTRLGRLVAIKLLLEHSGESAARFLIEARATAKMSHENIVTIHELGEHLGTPYMVLEYLEGKTLRQVLDERQGSSPRGQSSAAARVSDTISAEEVPRALRAADHSRASAAESAASEWGALNGLPKERAVALMIPVLRALCCAHEHGIIHRDLKPSNIMLTNGGAVKVLDFGIATVLEEPAASVRDGVGDVAHAAASRPKGTLPYMSPEQWGAGRVDHRSDIWAVGIILAELVLGRHPLEHLGALVPAAVRDLAVPMPSLHDRIPALGKLGSIIDRCLIKRCDDRMGSARDLLAELEALALSRRTPLGNEDQSPYAGLAPFREDDAPRFFGRNASIFEIIAQLGEHPLIVIVGPTGAGKSSFVRAGLIPALIQAPEAWEAFTLRPGLHPLLALAELLLSNAIRTRGVDDDVPAHAPRPDPLEREALVDAMRAEPGLFGVRLRARARRRLKRALLFVDQFEELYTLASETDRAAFIACLVGAADDAGSPLRVVLTLRSDFLDRLAEAPTAVTAVRRRIVLLPPMDRDGMREALLRPLEAAGYEFEPPELAEEMIDDVEHTSGALPLLSFAAAKLWEQRDRARRKLTKGSYLRIGGMAGTLVGHADAVVGAMSSEDRKLARALFLRLVTPDRMRALRTMAELCELAPTPDAMRKVLGRLIEARLLTVEGAGEADANVEIVHESLIVAWPTLAGWVEESRENAAFLARLRNAAREWETSNQSEDLLWRGQTALSAKHWYEGYAGELSHGEDRYLKASIALMERSRALRRRIVGAAFAATVAIAVVVSFLGILASRAADRERAAAEEAAREAVRADQETVRAQEEARNARNATRMAASRELAADPTTALSLLREVEPPDVPPGWGELSHWALHAGVAREVLHHPGEVTSATWSPDGGRIVTASFDGRVFVWNDGGNSQPLVIRVHESAVHSAAFSPDGKRIVTASLDNTARVWRDGVETVILRGHGDRVSCAAFSPDGARVVTASQDGTARVWSADGKGDPLVLRGHEDRVTCAAFSPDGRRIATSSWDRTARVWSADGKGEPIVLRGHDSLLWSAAFSPDGERIVTASQDGTARVWSADGKGKAIVLHGHEGSLNSAEFSPDGERIVTASEDRTARVWSADGRGVLFVLRGHKDVLWKAAFSPDGKRIITASLDRTARVWSADEADIALRGHKGSVGSAEFSSDGERIVTASEDGTARVWSSDGKGVLLVLRGHKDAVNSAVFSADGKRIVTASLDRTARVWSTDDTGEPTILRGPSSVVVRAEFSPSGDRVVAAYWDGTARVWSADGTGEPIILRGHKNVVRSAAFSPDGERIVTASADGTARVWSAHGIGHPIILQGHEGTVFSAAWSPDGKRIITASQDKTARIWSSDGEGEPTILSGHEHWVHAARFSPDGTRIVTASRDGRVRVWSAERTGESSVFRSHAGPSPPVRSGSPAPAESDPTGSVHLVRSG